MDTFKKILYHINPFSRFRERQYSIVFPLVVTTLTAILLEIYFNNIVNDPMLVRTPAVLIFLGLIIYFSFHNGLKGGITTTSITVAYYMYIIISQYTTQEMFIQEFEITLAFAAIYLALTIIIGGLKQKTDIFIEAEADEKNRLQTIIEQMPVGVIITDISGKVTYANKQLETIIGVKIPTGSVVGKTSFIVPERYKNTPLKKVLNTGKTVSKQQFVIEKKEEKKHTSKLAHHQFITIVMKLSLQQKQLLILPIKKNWKKEKMTL